MSKGSRSFVMLIWEFGEAILDSVSRSERRLVRARSRFQREMLIYELCNRINYHSQRTARRLAESTMKHYNNVLDSLPGRLQYEMKMGNASQTYDMTCAAINRDTISFEMLS